MHSDTEQNVNNNNEINITDSTAMSSSDNHMTLEQINVHRDDSKETRQLKELLLVHLDMITQQQEILMAKGQTDQSPQVRKRSCKYHHFLTVIWILRVFSSYWDVIY